MAEGWKSGNRALAGCEERLQKETVLGWGSSFLSYAEKLDFILTVT